MGQLLKNIDKAPSTCGECEFIGRYEDGPFIRNPHCCCELIFDLRGEDYKVDPYSLDEECPLKVLIMNDKI